MSTRYTVTFDDVLEQQINALAKECGMKKLVFLRYALSMGVHIIDNNIELYTKKGDELVSLEFVGMPKRRT
ncbi:MAG: hypothetical protein WC444_04210 [Candidatus Paceibacterota bacterium]